MEFIDHEATEEHAGDNLVVFSDDEELTSDEMEDFIEDIKQPREHVSFYG